MQFDPVGGHIGRVLRPQREAARHAGQAQRADLDRGRNAVLAEIAAGQLRRELGARNPKQQQNCRQPQQNR